jgi:hypothetical protein
MGGSEAPGADDSELKHFSVPFYEIEDYFSKAKDFSRRLIKTSLSCCFDDIIH